jgi:hypothetical protein
MPREGAFSSIPIPPVLREPQVILPFGKGEISCPLRHDGEEILALLPHPIGRIRGTPDGRAPETVV